MNLPTNPRIFLPPQMEDPKSLWEICLPHPWRPEAGSRVERVKSHTVDGSEIWRSPVEVGSLSAIICGFTYPRWLLRISEPSTVPSIKVVFACGAMMANLESLKKMGCISQAQMLWRLWRLVSILDSIQRTNSDCRFSSWILRCTLMLKRKYKQNRTSESHIVFNMSPWPNIICKFWWSFRMKHCCTNNTICVMTTFTATSSKLHVPSRNSILDQVFPKNFQGLHLPPGSSLPHLRFGPYVWPSSSGHLLGDIPGPWYTPKNSWLGTWKWTLGKGNTFWKPPFSGSSR